MATYTYTKTAEPNLEAIHDGVAGSEMMDKSILYCHWDEGAELLEVVFSGSLSDSDKAILDGIVEAS